jgi:hypothetical protein
MTIVELAKLMGDYRRELLAQGFAPMEALQMVMAYQSTLMTNDLLERIQKKQSGQPWD